MQVSSNPSIFMAQLGILTLDPASYRKHYKPVQAELQQPENKPICYKQLFIQQTDKDFN